MQMRRKAEFYITVQRRPGAIGGPNSNCSFGMTMGSIEAQSASASCFGVRRILRTEAAASNVPNCKDIMPQYDQYQQPDTSAQATFVVALIGLGILVLALLVLGGVLLRRWSRRRAKQSKDLEADFGGIQSATLGQLAAESMPAPALSAAVVMDAESDRQEQDAKAEQDAPARQEEDERPRIKGPRTREDRKRLEERMKQIEAGAEDEVMQEGELGASAGVLDAAHFKKGRRGGKLVMGTGTGAKIGKTPRGGDGRPESSSSGSAGSAGRESPADELYRSRLTARLVPGSPSGSRGPTPPEGSRGQRGAAPRRTMDSRGSSVAGDDIEFSIKHRPDSASTSASGAEWEDNTGIRIDDILSQARGAAANGKSTTDKSRAWKAGDQSPAASGSGSSSSGSAAALRKALGASASPPAEMAKPTEGSPSRRSPASSVSHVPVPPAEPQATAGAPRRPPVMAPLMAARLGIKPQQAIGGRAMSTLGGLPSQQGIGGRALPTLGGTSPLGVPASPGKTEPISTTQAPRAVMLHAVPQPTRSVATLPVAGQAGVPPPPPRRNADVAAGTLPAPRDAGGLARASPTEARNIGWGSPAASGAAAEARPMAASGPAVLGGSSPGNGVHAPFAPGGAPNGVNGRLSTNGNGNGSNGHAPRPPLGAVAGVNARPPLGAVGGNGARPPLGGNGTNGRDGRGMMRIGGGRAARNEDVIEELDD